VSYYIYYRVVQSARAQALVRDIQAAVQSRTGISGRVLRKRNDPATWMEIYEDVDDSVAFEQSLDAAVRACNFAAVLETDGARKLECFED
jgi:hypothetical protein